MDLSTYEVARLLRVSENSIFRMIRSETIPCLKKGREWRFKKGEIIAWLVDAREVTTAKDWENNFHINEEKLPLSELLKRGGIYYKNGGDAKEAVIKESLSLIKAYAPQSFIDKLVDATIERERLCSTTIGHGIALPHPKPFEGYSIQVPSISLFFLERSIPYGALYPDNVDILFFIFSGNKIRFLRTLTKLLTRLREECVLSKLKKVPLREEIYELFSSKEPKPASVN